MKRNKHSIGVAGIFLFCISPVLILVLAPRYPTMIERRIESARLEAASVYRTTQPKYSSEQTLEIIMPDGRAYDVEMYLNAQKKRKF
ncbi:hypothetical protein [Pseudomonas quasicaspiana]|uniref:hypothetical protein n=1 Tax=Pseudomonas quasicaspiana TaxID=2829821 RepID=UPI001E5F1ED2|nr:hypothetical protein [Pseudomonas quasicaspiana]MCD5972328.1 hypothetical protein [Pseudomonas quasicaspiana]